MHRPVDHRVRQAGLEGRRHRVPHGLLEIGQHAAIQRSPVPRQTHEVRVAIAEAHDVGVVIARDPWEQAVQPRKRLVPVARDRPPDVNGVLVESSPAPLVRVAVPVADQDVDQPRREERPRVHAMA